MASRALMTAAGVLWGFLLGFGAAILAAGMAAGTAWLFLFGDDSWPWWAEWAILGVGLAVGLAVFLACVVLTRVVAGRYEEREARLDRKGGSTLAWLLIVAAIAVGGLVVWNGYRSERAAERAAAARSEAQADFETLAGAVQRIGDIEIDWPGTGGDGRATLAVEGWRAGRYRLTWSVQDRVYERRLIGGERMLELDPGRNRVELALPATALAEGYRALLNDPAASVLVDETMDFLVTLEPQLTQPERATLPQNELQNLDRGWSGLIDHGGGEIPVRFFFVSGRLSWDGK